MEKQQIRLGLCSGCAGDYENPNWTAWDEDPEEPEELNEEVNIVESDTPEGRQG